MLGTILLIILIPPDQAKKLWVQVFETAEGGWGVGGQIFSTAQQVGCRVNKLGAGSAARLGDFD